MNLFLFLCRYPTLLDVYRSRSEWYLHYFLNVTTLATPFTSVIIILSPNCSTNRFFICQLLNASYVEPVRYSFILDTRSWMLICSSSFLFQILRNFVKMLHSFVAQKVFHVFFLLVSGSTESTLVCDVGNCKFVRNLILHVW